MFQLLWSQKAINFRDLEKFHSRIENHAVDKAAFFLWEECNTSQKLDQWLS